jgi:N-methylhydantoinase A
MLSSAQRQGTKKAGPATGIRVAIDTGGTFTDCVYSNGTELAMLKVPSTPANPAQAVLASVSQIAGQTGVEVRHGTTVGTNALLERKGARTCFIATAGFEDTIEIGRQARPKLYDWFFEKDPPLAPESMRIGVEERVASDGSVLKAVTDAEIARLQEQVRACRAESVAISFLFSFVNPRNERVVASALRELNLPLSISHEILPEFREYERGSTVLINAYLAPKMLSYIGEIDRTLNQQGSRLLVMQSSGGTVPAQIAAREPVRAIRSPRSCRVPLAES